MPLLRRIKLYRQVILVTHNANIVVNGDAEQIIVAHNSGEVLSYVSGSIENSFTDEREKDPMLHQGVREHVCETLEGGRDALKKKELKYGMV